MLWDLEMEEVHHELQSIEPPKRLVLAMKVMEWTLAGFGEIETPEVRAFIEHAMQAGRESVAAGHDKMVLSEEFLDTYEEVQEDADEYGTAPFLMAIMGLGDADEGLSGEVLFGVLNFCYQAIVLRNEEDDMETIEDEMNSPVCTNAIAFQKASVLEALRR
ncbi:MAG TPA: hypothetical protein VF062_01155 [Candidatus Limnocylindrales bacterium]